MPTVFRTATLTLLLATAATAASAAPAPPPGPVSAVYRCDDRSVLRVRYANQMARVSLPGGNSVRLPQRRSGSGFRYASARYELRGKGNAVTWSVDGKAPLVCQARRPGRP